ncbi:MAG TPA: hypothetical protein VGA30_07530 [Actinomycetota bacterium]
MSEERIRCPNCGAMATPGVEWCGQCFAKLGPPGRQEPEQGPPGQVPEVPAPPMPVPPAPQAEGDPRSGDPARSPSRPEEGSQRRSASGKGTPASLLTELWELPTVPEPDVKGIPAPQDRPAGAEPRPAEAPPGGGQFVGGEPVKPRPTWPCAVCGAANDLELDTCASCGAPFARLFQEGVATNDVEPKRAVAFSLAFPGLGHAVAGRKAEGLARAILFAWAAATAILLLTAHPAGGLGFLAPMAMLFVLSAIVWYAVTALDAFRLTSGQRQIVSSKVMLYGVAGLMLVSVASVLIMVTKAGHPH